MSAIDNVFHYFGVERTFQDKQTERYLLITLLTVAIIAVLVINLSQVHAVGFAGSEQAVRYTAYCVTIPIIIIGLLKGLSLMLITVIREQPLREQPPPTPTETEPVIKAILPIQDIVAPMPGKCVLLKVKVGDEVTVGQELFVVEAMKMQCTIRSEVAGKVSEILVEEGSILEGNQSILRIE